MRDGVLALIYYLTLPDIDFPNENRHHHEPTRIPIADDSWENDRIVSWEGITFACYLLLRSLTCQQAGVLSGKLQYGTAFGGSKVCALFNSSSRYVVL